MPKDIQVPGVGQALQSLFKLQGRVRPSLDEIILPTVLVGSIDQGATPAISRVAGGRLTVPAGGAGQFANIRLECPGSIIIRVDQIVFDSGAAGAFFLGLGSTFAAPTAVTANKQFFDGRLRQGILQAPAGVLVGGTSAGGVSNASIRLPHDPTLDSCLIWNPRNLVVASGSPDSFAFMEISFGIANTGVDVSVMWTEFQVT